MSGSVIPIITDWKIKAEDVRKALSTRSPRYRKMLTGAVNRRLFSTKKKTKKNIVSTLKRRRLVKPGLDPAKLGSMVHSNPRRFAITGADLFTGFLRTIEASRLPLAYQRLPGVQTRRRKVPVRGRRRAYRYILSARVAGRRVDAPGAWLAVKGRRWTPKAVTGIVAMHRQGADRKPTKTQIAPSISFLLKAVHADRRIILETHRQFFNGMLRDFRRIHARMN